jgi:hypothetical protein
MKWNDLGISVYEIRGRIILVTYLIFLTKYNQIVSL